ncbi:MAG: ATP synthase F1 subunit gamma [Armatimonadetes bacterium]|nr:ATP synthase F1 subunit gamma [Armatimonadota bacterium]
MAGIREIRRRIRVVKNIQQITNAMKMVAAARLKRAQDRAMAARPYADKMMQVLEGLSASAADIAHPLLEVREPHNIGVLLMSADRGLCGSYNTNLIRKTSEVIRPWPKESVKLVIVGRKGLQFFRRQGLDIVESYPLPATEANFAEVQRIGSVVQELFTSGQVDELYLVYSQFVSTIVQRPVAVQLLPIVPPKPAEGEVFQIEEYIYEPKAEALFGRLLPRYINTQIYRAMTEAIASEHGARMTSMSSATDNAAEMIGTLTLSMNRARQAAITKEISEIVGGANALQGKE